FRNLGQIFPPNRTMQVEGGVKIDAGRLTTTLSVFKIEQRSIISTFIGAFQYQLPNGKQRNTGAELNVFGEITPEFRVLGGVAL
ncbi:TonB-dependent receptor, partial [Acinetobacter baumannii]